MFDFIFASGKHIMVPREGSRLLYDGIHFGI